MRPNFHLWSDDNLHAIVKRAFQYLFLDNSLCGLIRDQLLGLLVFEQQLIADNYLNFLTNLLPLLSTCFWRQGAVYPYRTLRRLHIFDQTTNQLYEKRSSWSSNLIAKISELTSYDFLLVGIQLF